MKSFFEILELRSLSLLVDVVDDVGGTFQELNDLNEIGLLASSSCHSRASDSDSRGN